MNIDYWKTISFDFVLNVDLQYCLYWLARIFPFHFLFHREYLFIAIEKVQKGLEDEEHRGEEDRWSTRAHSWISLFLSCVAITIRRLLIVEHSWGKNDVPVLSFFSLSFAAVVEWSSNIQVFRSIVFFLPGYLIGPLFLIRQERNWILSGGFVERNRFLTIRLI